LGLYPSLPSGHTVAPIASTDRREHTMGTTRIAPRRPLKAASRTRTTHLRPVATSEAAEPAPQPTRSRCCTNGLLVVAATALGLALAYGTRVALSLTAVVGQRGELLLSIQPGPLAAGGAVVGFVFALVVRCCARRSRA
jgi:hypothetical protein